VSLHPITRLGHSHPPAGTHLLRVQNVHVHYGTICAIKNISFEVACGHCVGLLGRNGAGKSTLVKTIAGLNPVRSGTITWRDHPVGQVRSEIAYLPQIERMDTNFPLTVRGLVEMGRYPHVGSGGRWRKIDHEVVDAALEALQMADLSKRRLYQLSGGQLQRAQIARALAQEAHILLLDEPFAGLDEPSRLVLSDLLRELAENGRLLLVCHHDLNAVQDLFDTVLMLDRECIAFGPTSEIFTPENRERTFGRPQEAEDV